MIKSHRPCFFLKSTFSPNVDHDQFGTFLKDPSFMARQHGPWFIKPSSDINLCALYLLFTYQPFYSGENGDVVSSNVYTNFCWEKCFTRSIYGPWCDCWYCNRFHCGNYYYCCRRNSFHVRIFTFLNVFVVLIIHNLSFLSS